MSWWSCDHNNHSLSWSLITTRDKLIFIITFAIRLFSFAFTLREFDRMCRTCARWKMDFQELNLVIFSMEITLESSLYSDDDWIASLLLFAKNEARSKATKSHWWVYNCCFSNIRMKKKKRIRWRLSAGAFFSFIRFLGTTRSDSGHHLNIPLGL